MSRIECVRTYSSQFSQSYCQKRMEELLKAAILLRRDKLHIYRRDFFFRSYFSFRYVSIILPEIFTTKQINTKV